MTDYNDGQWHIWNGGECPVHGKSRVMIQMRMDTRRDAEERSTYTAGFWKWEYDRPGSDGDIIAFKVVKAYREPREFWIVGGCEAWSSPSAAEANWSPGDGDIIHVREVLPD